MLGSSWVAPGRRTVWLREEGGGLNLERVPGVVLDTVEQLPSQGSPLTAQAMGLCCFSCGEVPTREPLSTCLCACSAVWAIVSVSLVMLLL